MEEKKRRKEEEKGGKSEKEDGALHAQKKAKGGGEEVSCVVRDTVTPKELSGGVFFKIMTWNVAGLRAVVKANEALLFKLIDTHKPDVLCLQEHKLQVEHVAEFSDLLRGHGYVSFWTCSEKRKGYSGCVCFVLKSLCNDVPAGGAASSSTKQNKLSSFFGGGQVTNSDIKVSTTSSAAITNIKGINVDFPPPHNGEGRAITIEFDQFVLVNCYVPNSGQKLERLQYRLGEFDPFLRELLLSIQKNKEKPVILAGDLNVGHLDEDIHNPSAKHIVKQAGLTPGERKSFGDLLQSGFVDAFRYFHPTSRGQFSYWSQRAGNRLPNRGIRLDYFICSKSMVEGGDASEPPHPSLYDCYHLQDDTLGCSDHCPVMLVLKL